MLRKKVRFETIDIKTTQNFDLSKQEMKLIDIYNL